MPKRAFLFIIASLIPGAALAASATVTVSAQVVQPLSISSQTPLRFGTVLAGSGAGEIVVDANGTRQLNGSVNVQPGNFAAATFSLRGDANRNYVVQLPASLTFSVSNATGAGNGDLQVNNFTSRSANTGANTNHGTLDASGNDILSVGATLTVPSGAAPGTYSGTVPITVSYQ